MASSTSQQQPVHFSQGPLSKLPRPLQYLFARIQSAATRLETSTSISLTISRLKSHNFTNGEKFKWASQFLLALFSLFILEAPFLIKLFLPSIYATVILIPITSQFFLPATPIFSWLLLFASAKYIPADKRPHIWVSVLPTLETIWYGANVSDILTRFGHPFLDVLAWIPYGVIHFVAPFVVAACLFVFGPPASVKVFATSAGFMNVIGVVVQICIPCAPPCEYRNRNAGFKEVRGKEEGREGDWERDVEEWKIRISRGSSSDLIFSLESLFIHKCIHTTGYELREGLTPADYSMKGSPAGLARIDALFGSHGYTLTFTNAPVPFGAFPSLHAGWATTLALFCSYFFPLALELPIPFSYSNDGNRRKLKLDARVLYWGYCAWLYWCTMYLMHHYLIDLVAGGCLATACFYCEFSTVESRCRVSLLTFPF